MKIFKTNIRGAFFRPPAKELLANLPNGQLLRLEAELDNIHDSYAVKVLVDTADIAEELRTDLAEAVAPRSITAEELFSTPSWHLAYVERKGSNNCQKIHPFLDKVDKVELHINSVSGQAEAIIYFSEDVVFAEV